MRMRKEDKISAIGALGGIVICFLSILLTPPLEIPSGVYKRLVCMGIAWAIFTFGLAPKIVRPRGSPNYRDSGEPVSKEKLLSVVERMTEMGLTQMSTKDPVILALIEKTDRKIFRITEMTWKGEITLQQSLDDQFEIFEESHALMGILQEADSR